MPGQGKAFCDPERVCVTRWATVNYSLSDTAQPANLLIVAKTHLLSCGAAEADASCRLP